MKGFCHDKKTGSRILSMSHTGCLRTGSFVSWFMKGDPHIPGFFRLHPLIIYNKQLSWIFQCSSRLNQKLVQSNLVGGFNPSENIRQNGNLPPNRGENKKYLKFHHLKMFWTIQNDQARIRSLRLNDPGEKPDRYWRFWGSQLPESFKSTNDLL